MGRARSQHGTLIKTTRKSGVSSWWGRYRVYDKAGNSTEERTFLGFAHEIDKREARARLLNRIRTVNKFAGSVHQLKAEEIATRRAKIDSSPSRFLNGTISELVVAADLMRKGYEVFRALCGQSSCDLIAMKGGEFQRVEVKTGTSRDISMLRRQVGQFDIAAFYCPDTGEIHYGSAFDLKSLKDSLLSGNSETPTSVDSVECKAVS